MLLQRSTSPGPSGLSNHKPTNQPPGQHSPRGRFPEQDSPRKKYPREESPRGKLSGQESPRVGFPSPEQLRLEADGATAETVRLEQVQKELKDGWTVHIGREGRLYYCNHNTRTAGWLPPKECWESGKENDAGELPYGWEKATDCKGKPYYINHVNKTTTYVAPENRSYNEPPPEPRDVILERSSELGFGFVAGSEKPVVVRFVTENSPSAGKLEPGDEIWCVNGEDVRHAAREHVIATVRACSKNVSLRVCQPSCRGSERRGALLSPGKRARLRARPSRVRFADSVQVNGAPLYPPSAFSLGDLCLPPMANVLKVFLENGQTKSFKYDTTTTVRDVFSSLKDKLCITAEEYFSLVVEHVKSLRRNKLTLLDPSETLARIASRPGAHKMRCLFRVSFVPSSAADLAQRDVTALDYLYLQCANDVAQERFAPELQPDITLKLAALHMYQHALDNRFSNKLTVKAIEQEFGLERFIPPTLLESMKKKELRRILTHFLKLYTQQTGTTGQQKALTQLQAKLHYLDIIANLPSYGAKCFSSNQPDRVLLISPRFGLSQIIGMRSTLPQPIANLDELESLKLEREDELSYTLTVFLQRERVISFSMEDRDAAEMALVLAGYYRIIKGTGLKVEQEREPVSEDIAPPYVSQHDVVPDKWSFINYDNSTNSQKPHYSVFSMPPPYHSLPTHHNNLDNNMNGNIINKNQVIANGTLNGYGSLEKAIKTNNYKLFDNNEPVLFDDGMGFDINSVLSLEMLENFHENPNLLEARNEEVLRRVAEMHKLVENSERYLNENGELVYNDAFNSFIHNDSLMDQESSVDQLESDTESINTSDDAPGILKHSDSLLLLTESINQGLNGLNIANDQDAEKEIDCKNIRQSHGLSAILNNCGLTDALIALNNDLALSESDNDSSYTPTSSPIRKHISKTQTKRTSFEIHSPDSPKDARDHSLKQYLQHLREKTKICDNSKLSIPHIEITNSENDTEIIDLTLIPPPQTPDELDGISQIPDVLPVVPSSFADDREESKSSLDEFIATITVQPPTSKTNTAVELTPEEINAFIIPPPPKSNESTLERKEKSKIKTKSNGEVVKGTLTVSEIRNMFTKNLSDARNSLMLNEKKVVKNDSPKRTSVPNSKVPNGHFSHVIEYPTVERKGMFSCCSKDKCKNDDQPDGSEKPPRFEECISPIPDVCEIRPPPRKKNLDSNKPPARPPKSVFIPTPRPRSNSFSSCPEKIPIVIDVTNHHFNTLNNKKLNYETVCEVNESGVFNIISVPKPVPPPQIPPRFDNRYISPPPPILLPPKKPPLPPAPTIEVLRMKQRLKQSPTRHASIGSPHLQRNLALFKNIENEHSLTEVPANGEICHQNNFQTLQIRHVRSNSETHGHVLKKNDMSNVMTLCSPQSNRKFNRPDLLRGAPVCRVSSPVTFQRKGSLSPRSAPVFVDRRFMRSPNLVEKRGSPPISCGNSPVDKRNTSPSCDSVGSSSPRSQSRVRFEDTSNEDKAASVERLLRKTDAAVDVLLSRLHSSAQSCHELNARGGGQNIDEAKFQIARAELTSCAVGLVCASRSFVGALGALGAGKQDNGSDIPTTLAACLTPLRRLADLSQDLVHHTSAPLQTRNLVLRVHDATAAFKELAGSEMADILRQHSNRDNQTIESQSSLEGQLALRAECLANVLATLLRSLRVFSP